MPQSLSLVCPHSHRNPTPECPLSSRLWPRCSNHLPRQRSPTFGPPAFGGSRRYVLACLGQSIYPPHTPYVLSCGQHLRLLVVVEDQSCRCIDRSWTIPFRL